MKSKIKKIAIAISVFAISLISSTQVFALSNNLTMNKTTTYYNRYGSDGNNSSWYWTKYNFENRTAYCIEPGIKEGTIYNQGDWNNTGLSNSIRTRVYLLAYYGYDYLGHQTDSYRMATQAMIWEAVLGNTSVSFSTGRWNAGDQIDVSAERNQIESLIANHYTRPSFNGQTINLNVGETTTLTDTNNVLEKFDISVSGAEYSVNGNTLTIKPTQVGDIQIRMIKKTYTSEAPVIFYGDGIQNMVVGGAIDPVVSSISIHSVGGKLNISKKDLDNRNNTPQGDAKLAGTVYGLYDETGKLIEKLTITEAESIQSNTLPLLGRFYIQEITPGEGYQLDDTKYYFNSTLDNINASLELFDKVINRNYDITKVYADAETKIMTPEPNVEFGFFNSKGVLYKKATTDSNGRLVINLVYGKYTVKQLTTTPNYEKVDDFEIEVKEMGDVVYKVISNAEITSKLKVVKIDKGTGNVITRAGIKFKIKNLKTGEYVCQNITYPTTQKVCIFETDENGVFITPYALDSGTYQLEEVDQVIDGYLWNKESLPFEIGENSQVVKDENYGIIFEVQFENQRVKGKVEINKIGEEFVLAWIRSEFIVPKHLIFAPKNYYYELSKNKIAEIEKEGMK
ncbi:MAG: SpaA isopeptide-forming pilin-related protein [Clostridia bacterium]